MNYDLLSIDRPAPSVCRILINRPDKLNALNFEIREQMLSALPVVLNDHGNRALIFGGVGGNLSAGGDIPSMQGLSEVEARERMRHIHKLCRIVAGAGIPVLTVAEGVAAGGALGLALLGDYILADSKTRFMIPFLKLGLVPDWGMMHSLPQRVGIAKARQLIFEAKSLSGEAALSIGLADQLFAEGEAMSGAISLATSLSQLPKAAVAAVKKRLQVERSFEVDLACEEDDQAAGLTGREFAEGYSAFMEKRAANFMDMD